MITAALGAQYVIRPGFGEKPRIDEMFTIAPERCGSMIRPAARMQKKTPVCMTAIESCQSSSVTSCVCGPTRLMPALLTTMSRRPKSRTTACERGVDLRALGRRSDRLEPRRRSARARRRRRAPSPRRSRAPPRRTGLGELLGDPSAEARPGSRDDRDPPVEYSHLTTPFERPGYGARRSYPAPNRSQGVASVTYSRPPTVPLLEEEATVDHRDAQAGAPTRATARLDGRREDRLHRRLR